MKNALIALLAVALVVVGVFAYRQTIALNAKVEDANAQVQELKAKMEARTASEALELTAKCADQAEKVFLLRGHRHIAERLRSNASNITTLESHYNSQLNRCVMTIRQTLMLPDGSMYAFELLDAYEQTALGLCAGASVQATPFNCSVYPPSGKRRDCRSKDDFESVCHRTLKSGHCRTSETRPLR